MRTEKMWMIEFFASSLSLCLKRDVVLRNAVVGCYTGKLVLNKNVCCLSFSRARFCIICWDAVDSFDGGKDCDDLEQLGFLLLFSMVVCGFL